MIDVIFNFNEFYNNIIGNDVIYNTCSPNTVDKVHGTIVSFTFFNEHTGSILNIFLNILCILVFIYIWDLFTSIALLFIPNIPDVLSPTFLLSPMNWHEIILLYIDNIPELKKYIELYTAFI